MSHKKTSNFHQILRNLTIELRKGDQITIWHDGYQVCFKNVGTSNFKIVKNQDNNKNASTNYSI
jgi:hypothetical protein